MNDLETRLTALLQNEIERCVARINECEALEATHPDPKLRIANDRDRDRAFVALRRAMAMLKQFPAPAAAQPQAQVAQPEAPATPEQPAPPIARSAPCPCRSGLKYKRCCGRLAPPLPLRQPKRHQPLAAKTALNFRPTPAT